MRSESGRVELQANDWGLISHGMAFYTHDTQYLRFAFTKLHNIERLIVTVFISKNRKLPKQKHKSRDKQAMQDQVVQHRLGRLHI